LIDLLSRRFLSHSARILESFAPLAGEEEVLMEEFCLLLASSSSNVFIFVAEGDMENALGTPSS
jgi:hypothetical protein